MKNRIKIISKKTIPDKFDKISFFSIPMKIFVFKFLKFRFPKNPYKRVSGF